MADVDSNSFLDIVDFAAFASLYNSNCDNTIVSPPSPQATTPQATYDYLLGETIELPLRLYGLGGVKNAAELDVAVTNATITNFIPTTGGGWLSAIGLCPGGSAFTNNRVCLAIAKSRPFNEGEEAGTIYLTLDTEGTVMVERTTQNFYSDGATKVSSPGLIAQFTVGTDGGGGGDDPFCGYQDANADLIVGVVDFSQFARRYRQTNCQVTF
jgi:hypothetical protein